MKKLIRLTDRVWYYPFEEDRDRPNLGYIRGDRWSLAIDAGHSAAHTGEFYRALTEAGLPLPQLTVLTHWHWDHTFGMHAVHGLCLSNVRTCEHLKEIRDRIKTEGTGPFLSLHESIRREYAENRPVIVTLPDLVFTDRMELDPGNCPVRLFRAEAPHTDDSTLIHIPNERVLFIGDAAGGVFPTWEKNPLLSKKLAETLESTDADIVMDSHWVPQTKQEALDDVLSDT